MAAPQTMSASPIANNPAVHAIRLTVVIALAIFAMHIGAPPAAACSCVELTPSEAFERADSVFVGEVDSFKVRSGIFGQSSIDPATANFKVNEVWKGPQQARLTVRTMRSEASCGFEFVEGFRYLVYARDGQTGLCDRTALVGEARDDPAALGDGWLPGPESNDGPYQEPTADGGGPRSSGQSCAAATSRDRRAADLSALGLVAGAVALGIGRRPRL